MNIDFSDISFIIQGVADANAKVCASSIRAHCPGARIIYSTNTPIPKNMSFAGEQVIQCEDPGYTYVEENREGAKKNNVNRQIGSTLAGLKAATTKYAFKIRNDFTLTGADFLHYYDKFPVAEPSHQIFKRKLLACCFFSRIPDPSACRNYPDSYSYHPSDVAFFGLTEDLLRLYSIPFMPDDDYVDMGEYLHCRYFPEQYIFLTCLNQVGKEIFCERFDHITVDNKSDTERYFASNFIFLDFRRFNLSTRSNSFNMLEYAPAFVSCYTHIEWLKLYKRYVDFSQPVPDIDEDRQFLVDMFRRHKKMRRICNFLVLPIVIRSWRFKARKRLLSFFLQNFTGGILLDH